MTLDGIALGAVAAAAAIPVLRERLREPLNSAARHGATGYFTKLTHGDTHYAWIGPAHGPVAVCVHGLTTPSFVWRGLARHLAEMGFRVLIYDLFGRGYSDRPKASQTPAFFVQQLDELIAHLQIKGDITLMGYSMGGVIASAYAMKHPHMLRRVILFAPAGMSHDLGRLARFAVEWPALGDWMFHMAYPGILRRGLRRERGLPKSIERFEDMAMSELDRRGYLRSVLSSLRFSLRNPVPGIHRELAVTGVPVAAIWGREDAVIPLSGLGLLTQWNRAVQHEVIDGAGHGLIYTHTPEVAQAVRRVAGLV